jgi:light-regulated signal transduction histidine kinase (bacteriophytochrome)
MRDSAGRISMWIGSDTDIDEQKKSEVELRRLNDDLKQFAFAASHDLQEPLRMMTSYSQLLVKGYQGNLDGEAAICVDFVTRGAERMRDLLADLLSYTRVTADEQEPSEFLDLNLILDGVQQDLSSVIETSGAVIIRDALPTLCLHEAHARQLFQNLISNAIKYKSNSPPIIQVRATRELSHWRFAVSDNGMGIEPEYHQTIFGVFKRLHGKTIPGTGIGLAICQRVVERYGGRIWVDSRLNEGSTFYFTLPLAKEQINGQQTADASDPYFAGRR